MLLTTVRVKIPPALGEPPWPHEERGCLHKHMGSRVIRRGRKEAREEMQTEAP